MADFKDSYGKKYKNKSLIKVLYWLHVEITIFWIYCIKKKDILKTDFLSAYILMCLLELCEATYVAPIVFLWNNTALECWRFFQLGMYFSLLNAGEKPYSVWYEDQVLLICFI